MAPAPPDRAGGPGPAEPEGLERGRPLAGNTTVRTGGPAEYFLSVRDGQHVVDALRWARAHELPVTVLGSGSNVLVADDGVGGLVVKPGRSLASIRVDGERMICGAGARLPAIAARAAREGLAGIEFGVNIPGTLGGAVRMNAGAYGGELAHVLVSALTASADGLVRHTPEELGFAYRRSALREGEIVIEGTFALRAGDPAALKARLAELRSARHAAQPQAIQTFGSTFKNPVAVPEGAPTTAGQLLEAAGCGGLQIGHVRFSPKHANFIENRGGASTEEVIALMAEGRRRVLEGFGVSLEPEVQTLGDVRFPW
ncbi:MAG: UDP-N-acetylmuramate dehydrogenase [Acidobacteriota bacterium]|nr:UDP-N-acetylmuramate dehydrogenase [Acidobacteriota bacterium]